MGRRLPAIATFAVMAATAWVLAAKAEEFSPAVKRVADVAPGMGLFARPVVLRGSLGERQIQVQLRPKTEYEGVEGEYFRFGESAKVLLAGEADGEEILLEESENGTEVSGQWEGKRIGGVIEGNWQSADGSVNKPFKLTPVGTDADEKPKKLQEVRQKAKPAKRPAGNPG